LLVGRMSMLLIRPAVRHREWRARIAAPLHRDGSTPSGGAARPLEQLQRMLFDRLTDPFA
jgi:hypothetical protein